MKNYTSTVPVTRTISRIESALVRGGAKGIQKQYEDGVLVAIFFSVDTGGKLLNIRLPANVEAVIKVLKKPVKRPREGTLDRIIEQADRTAWKLVQEWIEIQISMIEMEQADFLQVFLPYVWDGKTTFYAAIKANGFKMLPEARKENV